MTNEELSKALQALAGEFGGWIDPLCDEDDGDYHAFLAVGDIQAELYREARHVASAIISLNGARIESGIIDAHHADTILVWLRAKLLELTHKERAKCFDKLLSELEYAHKYALNFDPRIEEGLRKLALGGE